MNKHWPITNLRVAVLPVRENNNLAAKKSFTEMIYNKSLLELRIEQLKAGNHFDKIYLSSDSRSVKEIADKHQVNFIFRNSDTYTRNTKWSDVIFAVVNSAQGFNPLIAWLKRTNILRDDRTTSMQVNPNHFLFDSLITVTTIQGSTCGNRQKMTKYIWSILNSYSNDLENLYRQTGALLIARKREIFKIGSEVDIKPHMHIVNRNLGAGLLTNENIQLNKSIRNIEFIQKAV